VAPLENPFDLLGSGGRLIGRAVARGRLDAAWQSAERGRGGLVLVTGEAGIGKTRLLAAVTDAARDGHVLLGRCYESAAQQPYAPIADAVRRLLQGVDLEALELPDVWRRELARLVPELGAGDDRASNAELDGVRERDRLFEAIRAFVHALAAERPVLLSIDDAQWCDETSLSLVAYLARSASSHALLIVLTCRLEELSTERRRLVRAVATGGEHIHLEPLDATETTELVTALAGGAASPAQFAARVHERTGGNPFFLIETLRALFDQGVLQLADGEWTASAGLTAAAYAELPVPPSVGLLLDSRIDRLPDEARVLAETAAVLRRDFPFDVLQAACGLPPAAALDALDRAVSMGLLREVDAGGHASARYDFAHALLRERIYEGLTGARRQYLHRQVAGRLESDDPAEPERVAYHYTRGGVRDRACAWSLRAGAAALAVYAAEDALNHFRGALELAVTPAETYNALSGAGDAEVLLGRPGEAVATFESALANAPDAEARADLLRRIGRAQERQGDFEAALGAFQMARKSLRGRSPSLTALRAADGLATVYVRLGRGSEAVALCADALAWLEAHPDIEGASQAEAWVRNTLGMAHVHSGEHKAAIPHLERSLELKRELGDQLGEATLRNNLGVVYYRLGEDETARDHYAASLVIKEAIGDGYGRAIALTNLALMETHLGDFAAAAAHLAAAEDAVGDVHATWLVPEIHRVSAQRYLALGDTSEARREAEEALMAAEALGVPAFIGVAHRVLGLVKAREVDYVEAAEEHFQTSLAVFEMQADEHELAKTRAAYAELLLLSGRRTDAELQLEAAAEVFRRTGALGRLARLADLSSEVVKA
jgi:tetratricopeptide (TPR) repeat protein